MAVQFPEQADSAAGKDVLPPLKGLLEGLAILPTDTDRAKSGAAATFTGAPDSIAIIEAGATAFSKWWSVAIGALGGTAAITAAATKFWAGQAPAVRVTLVGGIAGLLIATAIAIAVIVSADVRGRAQGAAAQYAARARVAACFLQESSLASRPAPVAAASPPSKALPSVNESDAQDHAVQVCLAASGARALVLHKPSNQTAHLAGVRQLDDGTTQLLLIRVSDQQTDWSTPSDIRILEFTYAD